jgi:Protein of unknown function (DUF4254)
MSAARRPEPPDQRERRTGAGVGALLPSAHELITEMDRAVRGQPPGPVPVLDGRVAEIVRSNLRQWELEDTTREPRASDAVIASAKRAIDRLNLDRHRLVQEIDAAIEASLDQPATARMVTESPGMVLDRLSVLVIRRARTAALSSGNETYAARLPAIDGQLTALSAAFDDYLEDLRAGTRRFVVYEHFKLYSADSPRPAGD